MNVTPLPVSQAIVPLQPHLRCLHRYKTKITKWNPYTLKNSAICYQFETGENDQLTHFIPDGCPDFFFCCNKDDSMGIVRGIQRMPQSLVLTSNSLYFGFKPYGTKGIRQLEVNWAELADSQIPIKELIKGSNVVEELAIARNFKERVEIILKFAVNELVDEKYTPDFVEYTTLHICNTQGKNFKVKEISNYTGYSARYCLEKFKESNGISIKNYSDIMRFQNVIRMLASKDNDELLSDIVFENGYFDQSHLNREFKHYTNNTPLSFKHKVLDNSSSA